MSIVVAIECYIFIGISKQLKTEIIVEQGGFEVKKIRYSAASYADIKEINQKEEDFDSQNDSCNDLRATYELAKSQIDGGFESICYDKDIIIEQYLRETEVPRKNKRLIPDSQPQRKSTYSKSQQSNSENLINLDDSESVLESKQSSNHVIFAPIISQFML